MLVNMDGDLLVLCARLRRLKPRKVYKEPRPLSLPKSTQKSANVQFGDLDELSLAYVLSIHKSQGSEFPCVVIPTHTQHYMMLQRNLFYTGVTRGKKLVILVGTKKALGMAVRRHDTGQRYTALRRRLEGREG
jgi:exodeoxyribonuclease V alpha subunit